MQEEIKNFINKFDRFAKSNGMQLLSVENGKAIAKMEVSDNHKNGAGIVMGGAIFTLADLALAGAANSYGKLALSNSMTINFIKKCNAEEIFATATEISRGRSVGVYNIKVTDKDGILFAELLANVFVMDKDILQG